MNPRVAQLVQFPDVRGMNPGWLYIVTNKPQGVLYVGVTSDLEGRIWEHRNHVHRGFTDSYNCTRLVWYEDYGDITDAIQREKQMKKWKREWKIRLIEEMNPEWMDLFETLMW